MTAILVDQCPWLFVNEPSSMVHGRSEDAFSLGSFKRPVIANVASPWVTKKFLLEKSKINSILKVFGYVTWPSAFSSLACFSCPCCLQRKTWPRRFDCDLPSRASFIRRRRHGCMPPPYGALSRPLSPQAPPLHPAFPRRIFVRRLFKASLFVSLSIQLT